MGRPTKPTALKAIEGFRGKRGRNKQEPDPDYLDQLEPPAWLPDEAAAVWNELAFKLRKAKVLTVLDVPAFEKLCITIATYRKATLQMAVQDLVHKKNKDKDGKEVPEHHVMNPWLIVQSMTFKQAITLLREFGMTPTARARVLINPQGDLFGNGEEKEGQYFTG